MNKIYLKGYVEKINEEQGILDVAIATDNSIDRDGEIIDSNGWDFENFLKNPVLLWAHDYRQPPIGKVLDLRHSGDKILFRPQFAIKENPNAQINFNLYKGGYLNAFSVGFSAKEWVEDKVDGRVVRRFTKVELLEISAVPVPANPNAVVLARGAGFDEAIIKSMEDNLKEVSEEKADINEKWKQVKSEDFNDLKRMSAWYDKENPEEVESYKLLHHNEEFKTVFNGVSIAMAQLMGLNGGVDIPEDEIKEVYDHLVKHYEEFEKEAPEYELVELQVLKDVKTETEMPIIVNVIKNDSKELEEIKKSIEELSIVKDSADKKVTVDVFDGLLSKEGTKRLLQHANKATSEVLRRIKIKK
jgi:HK97 family phage prohead protease